jgi:hypothetical protein
MSYSSSDNEEVLSAFVMKTVETNQRSKNKSHRSGSQNGRAANRERYFVDKALKIREECFMGEQFV